MIKDIIIFLNYKANIRTMANKIHFIKGEHQYINTLCGLRYYAKFITSKWEDVDCLNCWKIRGKENDKLNQKQSDNFKDIKSG